MDQFAPATANYNPTATKPTTLTDMLGLATSAQGLQQQQQATQTGAMALTINQAKFQEQQGIQKFMADPKNYLDEYGDVDMTRSRKALEMFPFLGPEVVNGLSKMSQGQSVASAEKLKLSNSQRGQLGNAIIAIANNGGITPQHFREQLDLFQQTNPGQNWSPYLKAVYDNMKLVGVTDNTDVREQMINSATRLIGENRYEETLLPNPSPNGRRLIQRLDKATGKIAITEDTSGEYPTSTDMQHMGIDPETGQPLQPSSNPQQLGASTPTSQPAIPYGSGGWPSGRTPASNERSGVPASVREGNASANNALTTSIPIIQQTLGQIEQVRRSVPNAITGAQGSTRNFINDWWLALAPDDKQSFRKTATDVLEKSIAALRGSVYEQQTGQSKALLDNISNSLVGINANPESILTVMDQVEAVAGYTLILHEAIKANDHYANPDQKTHSFLDTSKRLNEVNDLRTLEYAMIHRRSPDEETFKRNVAIWVNRQGMYGDAGREELEKIKAKYKRLEMLRYGNIAEFEKTRPQEDSRLEKRP